MQGLELEEGLCLISCTGVRGADRVNRLTMQICVVSSLLPKVQALDESKTLTVPKRMSHKACIGRLNEPNMLRSLFRWFPNWLTAGFMAYPLLTDDMH